MSLSDWLILLTIVITIVPLLKMAKEKRFGFYNISIVIIGIAILMVSIHKNRVDDRNYKDEKIADSIRLVATINKALEAKNLHYDPITGAVNNVQNQNIAFQVIGVDNKIENSRVEYRENKFSDAHTQFYYKLTSFAELKGIKDKGVYVFAAKNTNGAYFFPEVRKALEMSGFNVVAESTMEITRKYNPDTVWFSTHMKKIAVIVGNKFDIH